MVAAAYSRQKEPGSHQRVIWSILAPDYIWPLRACLEFIKKTRYRDGVRSILKILHVPFSSFSAPLWLSEVVGWGRISGCVPPPHASQPCVASPARADDDKYLQEEKHQALSTEHWALSTEHRALSTEHWALSTENWALSTEHRALSTEHWALSVVNALISTEQNTGLLRMEHWQFMTEHSAFRTKHWALSIEHYPGILIEHWKHIKINLTHSALSVKHWLLNNGHFSLINEP